jgi:Zn-dependent protease
VNGSLHVATAFGIPIRLHWTFLVLLSVFAWLGHLGAFVVLFGCVLLHELGHGLAAKRYGIRVLDIVFWPLGGMARMSDIPEEPRVEGMVAAAGPAVNFLLAALGTGIGLFALVASGGSTHPLVAGAFFFVAVNLALGTFNLLPAFPMDGGRLLRAWFARRQDWVGATERAVQVGRVLALALVALSLLLAGVAQAFFFTMPLIALFIWIAGGRELAATRMRHALGFGSVAPAPAEASWRPGAAAAREQAPEPIGPGEARRPGTWHAPAAGHAFDEERIRALERFRGRLRGVPPEG